MWICGCVKNCEKYIDKIFRNISKIISIIPSYKIVIAYDNSDDNTLDRLNKWKQNLPNINIIECNNNSDIRTENIMNARNSILKFIKNDNEKFDHFIMMDFDDVCSNIIDTNILVEYLNRDDWDCLSFNKQNYYDIWALSFDPYLCSCFQFDHKEGGNDVVTIMRNEIIKKLNNIDQNELLNVYSAFNGFAIYKINKFINCKYKYLIEDNFKYISRNKYDEIINMLNNSGKLKSIIHYNNRPSDCEHRHFHLEAFYKNNARICISPKFIFTELNYPSNNSNQMVV
jgi:hypothetical protein